LLAALVALVAVAGGGYHAGPAEAQTALPPSLQGEQFVAFEHSLGFFTGAIDASSVCAADPGETLTLSYSASGPATGPYTGTFTENGTITGSVTNEVPTLPNFAFGIVLTWTANFTIDATTSVVGPAMVTGTKTMRLSVNIECIDGIPLLLPVEQNRASAILDYDATIKTATGRFTDRGQASATVVDSACVGNEVVCPQYNFESFSEYFHLSNGVLPLDTSGKATGGGQVLGANPLERVTFGFNVRKSEDETRLQGTCNVLDHATGTHVKCLNVTDYQQIGNTATWEGTAEVNGVEEDYRITVQDNGEPNQGVDMFRIDTETYDVPLSPVTHGNVQLHKQELGL
jgi:hypothetical protein